MSSSSSLALSMPPPSAAEASRRLVEKVNEATAKALADDQAKVLARAEERRLKMELAAAKPKPRPRNPKPAHVLQEEDYTEVVSELIERDFFPDLPHLRLRQELYRARDAGDEEGVLQAEWKLANLARPTPSVVPEGGTPMVVPHTPDAAAGASRKDAAGGRHAASRAAGAASSSGQPLTAREKRLREWETDDDAESAITGSCHNPSQSVLKLANGKTVTVDLTHVRLDDFQRVFTSEDNASFENIVVKDKDKLRQRRWWAEDIETRHNEETQEHVKTLEDGGELEKGVLMSAECKADNTVFFKPQEDYLPKLAEKPKVAFENTRFTTSQQGELDAALASAVAKRNAELDGEQMDEALQKMVSSGNFGIEALKRNPDMARALAGRMQTPRNVGGGGVAAVVGAASHLHSFVNTPTLLPGVGGLSPLMTYGQIAGTPTALDEQQGPKFFMADSSEREKAAEKLHRNSTQRQRDAKQLQKAERLRALGISPGTTPGSTGCRDLRTPGSVPSRLASASPLGQLLHRAQRLAQKGGRLRIQSGSAAASASSGPPRKRARHSDTARTASLSGTPRPGTPAGATPGGATPSAGEVDLDGLL